MRWRGFRHRFFWGDTVAERRFGIALVLLALGLGVLLRLGGSDWREAASERLRKTEERFEREGKSFANEAERERALFKSLKREHFVKSGLWWAALVNLIVTVGLFFTRPLWCGRPVDAAGAKRKRGPPGRRFWIAVALAVVAAAALRAPRMGLSLYNDEAYNFRHYIHGQFKTEIDGVPEFEEATWGAAFWKNKANNGVMFSVLAKLADGGASPREIREVRLRLPALVPGLLSIVVVGLLGYSLFGGVAGGAAAWWLALHPWHLRYCTEARPYGLVLLFAALALYCLARALRDNRWPAWLGFAGCQFAIMWSFAGALYFLLGLNLAALFTILWRGRAWRKVALGRLVVSGVLAAIPYLQLMAPNFPQMTQVLSEVDSFQLGIQDYVIVDIFSYLATGMPAADLDPTNPSNPALAKLWPGGAALLIPGLLALAAIAFFAFAVFRRPGIPRALAWGNILALFIAIGASAASGGVLHRWYAIYLLPFIALAGAAGWTVVWKSKRLRPLSYVLAGLALLLVQVPLRDYLGRSKQQLRTVAAETAKGGAISAGFYSDAGVYDPEMRRIRTTDDFATLIAEARRDGRALRVTFGHRPKALVSMSEFVEFVETSGVFEKVGEYPGLEEAEFTDYVYRWNGRDPVPDQGDSDG